MRHPQLYYHELVKFTILTLMGSYPNHWGNNYKKLYDNMNVCQ